MKRPPFFMLATIGFLLALLPGYRGYQPGSADSGMLMAAGWFRKGSPKDAYALQYEGNRAYREGKFRQAVNYFSKAHSLIPDNFDVQLALALALGREGRTTEALNELQAVSLSRQDPVYDQKEMMRLFFGGMIHAYGEQYDLAIATYRKALEKEPQVQGPELLGMIYNALGYAQMLNQGGGDHGDDLPPHLHVHRRDMLAALDDFRRALTHDPSNEEAQNNYRLLRDSLGLSENLTYGDLVPPADPYPGLIEKIERTFDFLNYDEVVFLLDISGSMVEERVRCNGYNRFSLMKGTMQALLDHLPQGVEAGLGTVGGMCDEAPAYWHATGQLGAEDMEYLVRQITPAGSTPLFAMLRQSTKLFSDDPHTSKGIFLISDGANMCPAGSRDICQWAEELPADISINVLTFLGMDGELESREAFSEYSCLASQTTGKVLYIDSFSCRIEDYEQSMLQNTDFLLPDLQRVDCWGPAVHSLWGIMTP